MAREGDSGLHRFLTRRQDRRWARAAAEADRVDLAVLRRQHDTARRLRIHLDRFLNISGNRLALPLIGSAAIATDSTAEWAWRPEAWRGPLGKPGMAAVASKYRLGNEAALFHDCARSEITLRQRRNNRAEDLAPFAVSLDVFRFEGSYLSLAIDLPPEGLRGLTRRHLVGLETIIELERPLEIFARLNVKHGPNTDQFVRELERDGEGRSSVEFDLAYSEINEKRITKVWLDLIFEGPEMNLVTIRDLTMTRRPRAEI